MSSRVSRCRNASSPRRRSSRWQPRKKPSRHVFINGKKSQAIFSIPRLRSRRQNAWFLPPASSRSYARPAMTAVPSCVLQARGLGRSFPGVRALDDVSLCLRAGEVHALMGQNGAGKSTLIKVLTGVCPAERGTIELDGAAIEPTSPLHAQRLGLSTVYQEVNLCPNLSVAENILAGRYPRRAWWRGGGIDW